MNRTLPVVDGYMHKVCQTTLQLGLVRLRETLNATRRRTSSQVLKAPAFCSSQAAYTVFSAATEGEESKKTLAVQCCEACCTVVDANQCGVAY